MEGKKPTLGTSSSSLSSDLIGSKDSKYTSAASNSSSSGIFSSVFSSSSMGMGLERRQSHDQVWSGQQTYADGVPQNRERQGLPSKDRNSVFHDETVDTCYLSSSLYYGGQDVYSHSSSTRVSGKGPIQFQKDGGNDDSNNPNSASRGNWWQGSLYY